MPEHKSWATGFQSAALSPANPRTPIDETTFIPLSYPIKISSVGGSPVWQTAGFAGLRSSPAVNTGRRDGTVSVLHKFCSPVMQEFEESYTLESFHAYLIRQRVSINYVFHDFKGVAGKTLKWRFFSPSLKGMLKSRMEDLRSTFLINDDFIYDIGKHA